MRSQLINVSQSCLTLFNLLDCSLPGCSVHGISHTKILEWVAIPFSRGSSWPGIEPGSPILQVDFSCVKVLLLEKNGTHIAYHFY